VAGVDGTSTDHVAVFVSFNWASANQHVPELCLYLCVLVKVSAGNIERRHKFTFIVLSLVAAMPEYVAKKELGDEGAKLEEDADRAIQVGVLYCRRKLVVAKCDKKRDCGHKVDDETC
jgi:hypothetical protein